MKILSAKLPYPFQVRGKPRIVLEDGKEGVSLALVEAAGGAFLEVRYDDKVHLIPGHQYAHLEVEP